MKMILMIEGKEIDAISFPANMVLNAYSIAKVKGDLLDRNELIIDQSEEEPQYMIDGIPSRSSFFEFIGKESTKSLT